MNQMNKNNLKQSVMIIRLIVIILALILSAVVGALIGRMIVNSNKLDTLIQSLQHRQSSEP